MSEQDQATLIFRSVKLIVDWMNSPHTIYWNILFSFFRYVRLCDLDMPKEKWLNYL